jgi:phosphomevalonate kinase
LSIRVKVPGKLIILGEYAVLEGADALVVSVDRYVNVEISSASDDVCQILSNLISMPLYFRVEKNGNCNPEQNQSEQLISPMKFVLAIITRICSHIVQIGLPIHPFILKIDTSQFYFGKNKLGLGSSAALTVALIVSIVNHIGIEKKVFREKYDMFCFACDAHSFAQGNKGSGIDIAASVFGGVNVYNMNISGREGRFQQISPVSELAGLFLLPVWSGISVSTRKFLSQVEGFRINHETEYSEVMSKLSTLSNSGCETYSEKNLSDFLDILQDYYKVLKNFSEISNIPIISDIHEKIATIVSDTGGVYKSSGAGGGDLGMVFTDSEKTLATVKNKLFQNNIETLELEISKSGIAVEG